LGLSPDGVPIEDFLIDPPTLVDGWGVPNLGVKLIERDGVTHILDHIGTAHYETPAHFLEEVRRQGLSRRLSPNLPFEKLTKASRLLAIHDKAAIGNARDLAPWGYPGTEHGCPTGKHDPDVDPICLGACWSACEGEPLHDPDAPRRVAVAMPSFAFTALRAPEGVTPRYKAAAFGSFPIGALEVVRGKPADEMSDEEQERHADYRAKASKADLPVEDCDE
jgi:hypothetical protein